MNIVLLGATGFVGHHLVPRLARAGHHLTVLTRNRAQRRDLAVNPNTRLVQADVYDPDALAALLAGADAAVNMVGILNERGRDGSGFEKAHVGTAESLVTACRAAGVHRIVQVSALNAGKGESHYLRTKGEAEERLRAAEGLDVTILQPSVIFGPGDGFFNRFATLLALAPVMPLACPGARLQPVHVDDVCAAVERALEDPALAGRTLELAGPRVYTLRELVALTAKFKGYKRRIVGLPGGLSRLQAAVMDFVPGKPFSTDNYRSLQVDNVAEDNALPGLGIAPRSVECFVPDYLCGSRRQRHLQDLRRHAGR